MARQDLKLRNSFVTKDRESGQGSGAKRAPGLRGVPALRRNLSLRPPQRLFERTGDRRTYFCPIPDGGGRLEVALT